MKRFPFFVFIVLGFFLLTVFLFPKTYNLKPVLADDDEILALQKEIDKLNQARQMSLSATKPLEGQLENLQKQLIQIQYNIELLSQKIVKKEKDLDARTQKIAEQQALLEVRVRSYYIRSFLNSPLAIIFSQGDAGGIMRELSYRMATAREDQKVITSITEEITDLLVQKEKLEKDKVSLAGLQVEVDKNAGFLGGEIKKAKDFQADLSKKIAELTAKQQAILAAKSGNFVTSVGDVPLADDANARPTYDPGFRPAFAAFSFGAYTHRNGMSQYGAKGRAESGQNAEQILAAYYPGSSLNKSYSVPSTINVDGYGSRAFEDEYMKRIYEMPNSFPKEALKAQAVAARTYAIRRGGSICATESCQVYKDSNKGGAWEEAVRETKGWVLEGGPGAQYSSTTGGYGNNSGWDTKCGGRQCWTPEAYEKIAGSPWFYKGWYRDRNGASCGKSHPWLNEEQMSDILNAYIVYKSGDQADRVSPVDTSCWPGNPFTYSEMKDKANNHGGAVTTVGSVSVTYSNDGSTANVSFATNRGSVSISGSDFKTIFNLRAPGYVSIKSPLYNIETK
ncbi:MAG TPA: SpoIID/LytB domain-containing protein [Patescibacteria group bacterium]|nr:SpoIID/LytB domain-containing protein [Patescibacteria group bacterium]